jgi:hypothetical protein
MSKMTKWDTIQADVSDMYVGSVENEKYYADRDSLFDDDDMAYLDGDLTLDWDGE